MQHVVVVFKNGNIVEIFAEEFSAELDERSNRLQKMDYKDAQDKDSAIYLRPGDVSGIFVTSLQRSGNRATHYIAPGQPNK